MLSARERFLFWFYQTYVFFALSLSPGHNPAQEEMCLSVGKRSMSVPMTEMIACALGIAYAGHILNRLRSLLFFRLHKVVNFIVQVFDMLIQFIQMGQEALSSSCAGAETSRHSGHR